MIQPNLTDAEQSEAVLQGEINELIRFYRDSRAEGNDDYSIMGAMLKSMPQVDPLHIQSLFVLAIRRLTEMESPGKN